MYDPKRVEEKWQARWAEDGTNQPDLDGASAPYFNLMMFPYPSAEGLHVGMQLRVAEVTPQRVRFWAGGDEHILAPLLAANIAVEPLPEESPAELEGEPLTALQVGEIGQIQALTPRIRGAERRRLMDLGILPGTQIEIEMRSPGGDPTAYRVRGAVIALRTQQTDQIRILRLSEESA